VTRLADIAIRMEPLIAPGPPMRTGGLGGGVIALLTELAGMLERLAGGARPAAIDLLSLPISPQDRAMLQEVLGDGEVRATVHAAGISSIRETRVSGLWWVEHRDVQGEVIAESIEVTRVPDILSSAPDEIAAAARDLRSRIGEACVPHQ
jgi:hydrogenase-1 operon protein HyaF